MIWARSGGDHGVLPPSRSLQFDGSPSAAYSFQKDVLSCQLPKLDVAGSIPVPRSSFSGTRLGSDYLEHAVAWRIRFAPQPRVWIWRPAGFSQRGNAHGTKVLFRCHLSDVEALHHDARLFATRVGVLKLEVNRSSLARQEGDIVVAIEGGQDAIPALFAHRFQSHH
jgi:hypothetical protein